MIIKTFLEPPIDNNNYVIIDETSKEAALIDCSSFDKDIIAYISEQGAKLKYILLTHGHFDHIGGINEIKTHFDYQNSAPTRVSNVQTESSQRNSTLPLEEGIEVVMNKNDLRQLNQANQYLSIFGMPEINVPEINKFVEDGDILKLGNTDIKVIHTPGHTQGGVCYLIEDNLFSGDTIFRECVGRCDLDGGDFVQIVESIKEKIFTLSEDVVIYPGHGSQTTVGWEKVHNRFA